ncbi:Predicted arabinose efflux permease, MFS family [Shimia gijangensis]|uniref:Predicted arabinose efflux permease, MFS family n=1 Tax=Shimia gijangensis TaxID=1470563 RepID=A0A1M6BEF9_9RHOB|nr:MFS transporter [Shimia gijangensis]SHI47057.1 Predicted arabinose efflux permease, MFS family [Shimia gijangensis]
MNFAALKSPNFRTYISGSFMGLLSLWMQRVTSGWLAWDLTNSASFVGLVALLQFAPAILLSPLFGVWADRLNVKRSAVTVQSLNCLIAVAFFAVAALGWLTPFWMGVLSLASGIAAAASHPVRMSLTPRLVERDLIGSVVNIVAINFNVARMLGPALGGLSIGVFGVTVTLFIQALLYVPYVYVLTRLTLRPRRDTGSASEPFFHALAAGFRHVWTTPVIWRAMVIVAVLSLVARGTLEILPPLADGIFDRGASGLGVLLSATGAGAIIGGVFKGFLPPQEPERIPRLSLAFVLLGLGLVPVLGAVRIWEVALIVVAGMAFVTTLTAISMQTAIQIVLEDDMRGRVMSLWAVVAAGGSALGAGILGVLADVLGYELTLFWAGSGAAVCLTAYFVYIFAQR